MFGGDVDIRAEVVSISGLSAHGDSDDLMRWAKSMPAKPRRTFLVHGEPPAQRVLAARLKDTLGWQVDIPQRGTNMELT
jgi:metallo-beta-lactamase family protein